MNQWRLDTLDQTLVLSSIDDRLPSVIYWGKRLPDNENLRSLSESVIKDWSDNLLDKVPEMSILPEQSANFSGQLGCKMRGLDGNLLSSNVFYSSTENKKIACD